MTRGILSAVLICLASLTRADVPSPEPDWFPVGETFTYRLYWGPLRVGRAVIWSEWTTYKGRRRLALKYNVRTTSVLSKIFPVNDTIESIVDPDGFRTLRYRQILHEGRHYQDEVTIFDHEAGMAYHTDRKKHRSQYVKIEPDTKDTLTFIYHMRSQGYRKGQYSRYQVFVDDKAYDLTVRGIKDEAVKLRGLGKIPCVKLEPLSSFGKIYKSKGKVLLWLSRDKRRVITRMSGRVPMASMRAVLVSVSGPGDRWP